jgi:DNA-binding NtrC family response regulator
VAIENALFLLVGALKEDHWAQCVVDALSGLGSVHIAEASEVLEWLKLYRCALAIVDESSVPDAVDLVSRMVSIRPDLRLVVVTPCPTWTGARETLLAGSMDYLHKSPDERSILSTVRMLMEKSPRTPLNQPGRQAR